VYSFTNKNRKNNVKIQTKTTTEKVLLVGDFLLSYKNDLVLEIADLKKNKKE
jgi:hypothetical protein